jgi:hypothetical protein
MSGPIQLWTYVNGDESNLLIEGAITGGLPITTLAKIAPDPNAMLQAVAADPTAIGYIPKPWVNATVRKVEIDPTLQQALILPILSISTAEPQGAARAILGCLQSRIK